MKGFDATPCVRAPCEIDKAIRSRRLTISAHKGKNKLGLTDEDEHCCAVTTKAKKFWKKQNHAQQTLLPILGKLRFLADKTRPDIMYILSLLSGSCNIPLNNELIDITVHLLQYLRGSRDIGKLVGGKDLHVKLFGFCDASYVTTGDSMSQLGTCFFITKDSASISASSKKDTTVSHSSTEAEIKAIDKAIREAIYYRSILEELSYKQEEPTTLYIDSKSAKEILETLKMTHKIKHINLRINYIREVINRRSIRLVFVPSKLNVADVLTKPCIGSHFIECVDKILFGFDCHEVIEEESASLCFAIEHL
jgi:hypothetical protein